MERHERSGSRQAEAEPGRCSAPRIAQAPALVQTLAYMVLGLVWILPLLPLIRWMEKPDPDGA